MAMEDALEDPARLAFSYFMFACLMMLGLCPFFAMVWRSSHLRAALEACHANCCVRMFDHCMGRASFQYDPRDLAAIAELEEGEREREAYRLFREPRNRLLHLGSWREDLKNGDEHNLTKLKLHRLESLVKDEEKRAGEIALDHASSSSSPPIARFSATPTECDITVHGMGATAEDDTATDVSVGSGAMPEADQQQNRAQHVVDIP